MNVAIVTACGGSAAQINKTKNLPLVLGQPMAHGPIDGLFSEQWIQHLDVAKLDQEPR